MVVRQPDVDEDELQRKQETGKTAHAQGAVMLQQRLPSPERPQRQQHQSGQRTEAGLHYRLTPAMAILIVIWLEAPDRRAGSSGRRPAGRAGHVIHFDSISSGSLLFCRWLYKNTVCIYFSLRSVMAMTTKLTPRQQEILDFIRNTLEVLGARRRAEISSAFGFASPNAAEEHLKALAKKGSIVLPRTCLRARHPPLSSSAWPAC